MVRINQITRDVTDATVLAKIETFNPGNSIKDRIAVKMIEDAERAGRLKPGGTIIEGTSGNTGMGLAIVAAVKGYRCLFTTTDKQSKEKIDALKAFGAEVIVCPTDVDPEDPRSYYSVSSRLEREIPERLEGQPVRQPIEHRGALRADGAGDLGADRRQGRAPRGRRRHRRHDQRHRTLSEGAQPEDQGVGHRHLRVGLQEVQGDRHLRQERDLSRTSPRASARTSCRATSTSPSSITSRRSPTRMRRIMTRRLAREEGIFAGNSAGAAMAGVVQLAEHFKKGDVVVVVFHDHGSRYLGKMYNDEWMRAKGFLEVTGMTARDLVAMGVSGELFAVEASRPVEDAVRLMGEHDFSQISVTKNGRIVGSLNESHLYDEFMRQPELQEQAGRGDHAAGVPVRGHLDAGGAAVDDDHAGESGGAGPRLQDRQDVHHHAVGHHSRDDVVSTQRRSGVSGTGCGSAARAAGDVCGPRYPTSRCRSLPAPAGFEARTTACCRRGR